MKMKWYGQGSKEAEKERSSFSRLKRPSFTTALFLVSLPFQFFLSLDSLSQVRVSAEVDRRTIYLGERIELTIEARIPKSSTVDFFSIDTIPHFEFIHKGEIDTVAGEANNLFRQVITITSFDSGRWVIPSFILPGTRARTDTIGVFVGFSPFNRNQDYHDVKEVLEVQPPTTDELPWKLYALAIFIAGLLIMLAGTRKPANEAVAAPEPVVDPYEEALRDIDLIAREYRSGTIYTKDFYSRLTDVLRVYVARRKGFRSFQKTTDDLVLQLRSLSFSEEAYRQLAQVLRLSDFVKFAKYVPERQEDESMLDTIRDTVKNIESKQHG